MRDLLVAVRLFAALTVLTGVVYPLLVTGFAQVVLPEKANGSLIVRKGRVVGSRLIGQPFESPAYFWGRPSSTQPYPYNAAASGGSNLGPTNPALLEAIRSRVAHLRAVDPDRQVPVPTDLVTASGSGLDPHITAAAAEYQIPRVARERHATEEAVRTLVRRHLVERPLGFLGEPVVNVLELNLALDEAER